MDAELLVRAVKALAEVAGLAFIGQGIVAIFAGSRRDQNVVYQIFKILTNPVVKATRFLTPKFMPDRHMPYVAFGLILWIWLITIVALANLKRAAGA